MTKKKTKLWLIVLTVLIGVIALSCATFALKINNSITTDSVSFTAYSIGSLDEQGKPVSSSESLYTEAYYSVDGLKVQLKEKANVTYKLFWYDSEKNHIGETVELSDDYSGCLEGASYFRVLVTPIDDAEVTIFELMTYAGQLNITFNK